MNKKSIKDKEQDINTHTHVLIVEEINEQM